jgi:hypothetical protein
MKAIVRFLAGLVFTLVVLPSPDTLLLREASYRRARIVGLRPWKAGLQTRR